MSDLREGLENQLQRETESATEGWLGAPDIRVPGLTVLYHPNPSRVGEQAALMGLVAGKTERLSRLEPDFATPGETLRRPLADPHISRRPVRLKLSGEKIRITCSETRTQVLADGSLVEDPLDISFGALERGVVLMLANRVVLLLHRLEAIPLPGVPRFGLVGESPPVRRLRQEVQRVAALNVPVLLRGETGSGKELVAHAIHQSGPRRDGPFVAVNMGAIPASLAAAELFGVSRGAFTGADRPRSGYFTRAHGGTLFLDEIGETPPEVQVLLLRALESQSIQAVGAEESTKVDLRCIAATDTDLEAAVDNDTFRAPLLHRLTSYEIWLPALRERREDFGRLFFHFLREELAEIGEPERLQNLTSGSPPWLPAALVARLAALDWPGNVRQLQNVVRQLVIGSRDAEQARISPQVERLLQKARVETLGEEGDRGANGSQKRTGEKRRAKPTYRAPSEVGEEELLEALRANLWRLKPTAAQLGISRGSLYVLIEKCPRVRKGGDLSREEIEAALDRCGGDLDAAVPELQVSKEALKLRLSELDLG